MVGIREILPFDQLQWSRLGTRSSLYHEPYYSAHILIIEWHYVLLMYEEGHCGPWEFSQSNSFSCHSDILD